MSSRSQGDDPGSLSGPLGIDVGPPLSSRQRKAAAAFTLAQLLALAELRATARRKQAPGRSRPNGALSGCSAATARAPVGLAALSRLRQSATKRRIEDEADAAAAASAPQRPRSTSTAATAVSLKRIAIVPPPGTQPPTAATAAGMQLGCHLARRCGGSGRGGVSSSSSGGLGPSSLARVYGSRVRVGQLPEDYSECFVGLEAVRQPDVDEQEPYCGPRAGVQHLAAAGAGAAAECGGGLAAPPTGGALLGSVSVGEEMSFLFAANAGVTPFPAAPSAHVPEALAQFVGLPGQGSSVAGGLLAPFAASAADPALAGAGLPYMTGQPYGAALVAGFGGDLAPAAVLEARAVAAAAGGHDLMLDADEGSSSETEDEDERGGGGMQQGGMQTDAALGTSLDEFDGGGPLTQPAPPLSQSRPTDGYVAGFGGLGSGAFEYGGGGGAFTHGGGGGMGMGAAAGGGLVNGGAGLGFGPIVAVVEDDEAMVEEF